MQKPSKIIKNHQKSLKIIKKSLKIIKNHQKSLKIVKYSLKINENDIKVLLVRSATTARKELIDSCPNLKMIGRGGVGMDNIDVDYAKSKNIEVINTPAASSESVAELVFCHLFSMVRFMHDSNRNMPLDGDTKFKDLKKAYAKGKELRGKTLGIVGFGRIGQEVAKRAIGLGMSVVACDKYIKDANIELSFFDSQNLSFKIETEPLEKVLEKSDFLTNSLVDTSQNEYIYRLSFNNKKELQEFKQKIEEEKSIDKINVNFK